MKSYIFGPELKDCISPAGQLLADASAKKILLEVHLCFFTSLLILLLETSQEASLRAYLLTDKARPFYLLCEGTPQKPSKYTQPSK